MPEAIVFIDVEGDTDLSHKRGFGLKRVCKFSRLPVVGEHVSFSFTHDSGRKVYYRCPVLRVTHSPQQDSMDSIEIGMDEDHYHTHCVPDEAWEPMLFSKE